jgi:hypothetical protein
LVRAYRNRRNTFHAAVAAKKAEKLFLKVGIDGVPYISKVALRMYKGYRELREALDLLFSAQSFWPARRCLLWKMCHVSKYHISPILSCLSAQ